ncbi:glycoside hydrolase family 43 protein [Aliifodinibius salicampi]|uniref:Glycoside hydrolase family 43 protein n=1 Tax=Fodinibius salicampi TaxID=1920655 RepID=A0ABT3Q065_9BACT|nr:glycoside hydrolase family 43 protein [Fodinibius salicampi]MCW9713509.1 glycoside hydrolase family 43 protein [Fodinibius salicampi]
MKVIVTLLLLISAFTGGAYGSTTYFEEDIDPCLLSNPVADGQDPWITKKDGYYYYIETRNGGLYISKSENLSDIKTDEKLVWELPESGWNKSNLWAPELHFIQGKWYIYYTAGKSGPPFIHQRSGVLVSETDDPMGGYIDKGQLYTGNNIQTKENNIWSIDLTVLEHNGQLYGIWSGWEDNRQTDKTPQHLYIAKMDNPWTISSNRVKISSPVEPWETGSELAINEGAQVLKNGDNLFIIYSASESWLPAYNLGQLRLIGEDPMNPDNWEKKGPVFEGTEDVHGVGHASFTTSPDGTEHWIAYHTKISPDPGWERVIHLQPFSWSRDGSPNFGDPVSGGISIPKPSGACKE